MTDVKRSERLVPELERGFGREGPGQEDPHPFASRQPTDGSIGEFDQVATLDEGIDTVVVISVGVTSLRNDGSHGETECELGFLGHPGGQSPAFHDGYAVEVTTEPADFTGMLEKTPDRLEQRALA